MTKAEEVFTKVEELVAGGMTKADAFKHLAEFYAQPVNSIRGSYYQHTRGNGESKTRTRRRETTPEDALADAKAVMERAILAVDAEVVAAEERAKESAEEAKALKASAKRRKDAIAAKLEALG